MDTSALLKRYIAEPGSDAVAELLCAAREVCVSSLCVVEAASALTRRESTGDLAREDYDAIWDQLTADLEQMEWIQVDDTVLLHAVRLAQTRKLRTLDAIHLACAMRSAPDRFACADRSLGDAAAAEGLHSWNPCGE